MQFYVKHATLINNCYPEKDGEYKPRSSELSYLTFYASSKPAKLTKVGSFLEKKAERDVVKSRKQSNQVTLEIVKALIEACPRDLNLFSKNVVKIIDMMSSLSEVETVDLACQVFVVFAEVHDGSTLGVDEELTNEYESLLKKFARFCFLENKDDIIQLQMRYIGQRGLQAAIRSNALQASNFHNQLDTILLPIMITLSTSKNAVDALARSEDIDIKRSVIGHETLNAHLIDILAAKSIGYLFSKANAASVKLSLGPLFNILDTQNKWWPSNFAVSMMELALHSLQPQFRYILVPELLQQMDTLLSSNQTDYLKKYASLVSILDAILNAHVPLVGISVLEVLNSLFTLLIKSVCDFQVFQVEKPSPDDLKSTLEYTIQFGLAHSMAGLASETYYLNQLTDITGYIITQLRVGTDASEMVDGLPLGEHRKIALNCLDLVTIAASAKKEQYDGNAPVEYHATTLDFWLPALGLLTDKTFETRVNFALTLAHYIEATTTENEVTLDPYPKHTLIQRGDILFVNALHQTVLDWIQLPNLEVQDVKLIKQVLLALVNKFGADEVIKGMPLIFKIQSLVKQLVIEQPAVTTLVIEWLASVANMYRISSLTEYMDDLQKDRMRLNEDSPVDSTDHIDTFKDLEPDNTTTLETFVDRKKVVDMISSDGPLRDPEDTEGTELESKLMLEWGVESYSNSNDRSFRIRTSRYFGDLKVKLSTPWSNSEINCDEPGKKKVIMVENLKDVLYGQVEPQNYTIQSLTTAGFPKGPGEIVHDVSLLLQSLSIGNESKNTTSLVNPPYK